MSHLLPLQMLAPGRSACVEQLLGQREHVQRLQEMGLRLGARVEMVQSGAPCILRLAGSTLCLRDGDAFQILVREEATGATGT